MFETFPKDSSVQALRRTASISGRVIRSFPRPRTGRSLTAPQADRSVWTIQDAERLILSLTGVVSARLVTRPGGEVEEIHVLTTDEIGAKQTVRNVESALLAHYDLEVDHRKISVAQTKTDRPRTGPSATPMELSEKPAAGRVLFKSHQACSERSRRVRHRVDIEWLGRVFTGETTGADLPRARLEAVARATLQAVESALLDESESEDGSVTLALDGVKVFDAFDRTFVLVAVHAVSGQSVTPLAGATGVEDSPDRATILAALQATDRWVRGRLS